MPVQQITTFKVGIDVGGTFTDFSAWSSDGRLETFKVLSTPSDPSIGVVNGLKVMARAEGLDLATLIAQIDTIVHGTTVTTNATLTRKGPPTGLITTRGVRDALEMRRGIRERRYDNRYANAVPIVPRRLRRGVPGRLDWLGRELEPLDLEAVRAEARLLRAEGVEAVAICFMNAFANAGHEQAARAVVADELPNAFLSVSTEVLPTVRFYDRVSTACLNAFVGPVLRDYLGSLTRRLAEIGFDGVLLIMQSSGGVAVPEVTLQRPAVTLLSGPAAGPRAALGFAEARGHRSCLLADMGGTSFDASLVADGEVALMAAGEIDRLRIALPMLDIVTIGAGGGSVGWIDGGGLLRMGPQSAGAQPGPACYGRGGSLATCTDADLLLGYLDPAFFAGGELPLQVDLARQAVQEHIAGPLGMSVEEAAAGMYRVINTNMAHGVREITIKRGLDPREFPLVMAGGAGGIHACMIADELEIPSVVVPPVASILCSTGALLSDLQHDFARSHLTALGDADLGALQRVVDELVAEGDAQLAMERVAPDRVEHHVALDLRYLKQYHEVTVGAPGDLAAPGAIDAVREAFHREHDRLYGYHLRDEGTPIELITVRVRSVGRTAKPALPRIDAGGEDPGAALKGRRRVFVPERGAFESVPVFDGHRLGAGNRIAGPALVERRDTTIFVSARYDAEVDSLGTCWLTRRGALAGGHA